jgi:integrase
MTMTPEQDTAAPTTNGAAMPVMNDLFERVFNEHWIEKKRAAEVRRIYLRDVAPRIGNHRLRDVDYSTVNGLHRALAAAPVAANRALAVVSTMLNMAERYGWRDIRTNPCFQIPRHSELSRRRYAKRTELSRLGAEFARRAQSKKTLPGVVFIMLVLLTGARPGEIAAARWEWLDGSVLRLPDSKTGVRDIYLPPQATTLLKRLKRNGPTLTGVTNPKRLWDQIRQAAGCPDLRLYDLRRTFATVGMATTKNVGLVGELLGHTQAQTTKIYARLWDEAAQEAANQTGAAIEELLT